MKNIEHAPLAIKHRDYAFLGTTQSLCPECRSLVPAKIIVRNRRVYFRKKCPTHGMREDFICSDVSYYDRMEASLPAKLPAQTFVQSDKGCPFDCGLCEEHEQHTCIGVVEITDNCNLTCGMCYAASSPGQKHKSLDDIKRAIDGLVRAEGRAEVLQLSGGEPTLHPNLLDAVRYAMDQPIDYVMINTNGIRLANDSALVDALSEYKDRLEIYLQFDSLVDAEVAVLRGQEGLVETKLRALERIEQAGLNVTLVATLQAGVNPTAPQDLVEFSKSRPFITGISFQPATYSGRSALPNELNSRITFPDVIKSIANESTNQWSESDFFPLPCAHPNCHWISLAVRDSNDLHPITKWIDAAGNLDLLANGISFTKEQTARIADQLVQRLACGDSGCCSPSPPLKSGSLPIVQECCEPTSRAVGEEVLLSNFLDRLLTRQAGARDLLRITITSFLDVYNFDLRRVMKCCTHHVLPTGHVIPFCAYNVLYRDGTVALPPLNSLLS